MTFQIGDIILVSSKGISPTINKMAQSLTSAKISNFSHVAIVSGPVSILHAENDTENCVDHMHILDFRKKYSGRYKALRHEQIAAAAEANYTKLHQQMNFFLGQTYISELRTQSTSVLKGVSKLLPFSNLESDETICSILANDFLKLQKTGLEISKRKPFPVHFQKLESSELWTDVTDQHKMFIQKTLAHNPMRSDFEFSRAQAWSIRDTSVEQRTYKKMLAKIIGKERANEIFQNRPQEYHDDQLSN